MDDRYRAIPSDSDEQFGKPQRGWRQAVGRWLPITVWLPAYQWKHNLVKDLFGALTLGCILIAQSLAHADLCRVKLIHGPYSCIVPPLLYSVFGTCIHASVGTGGLISLLTGDQLRSIGDLDLRTRAGAIFTAEVGVILTVMAVLRLSFLTRFLSRPALSGFVTGSALLIIRSQLSPALGMPEEIEGVIPVLSNWRIATPGTVGITIVAFLFIRYAPRYKNKVWFLKPLGEFKELIALIFTAVFCSQYAEQLNVETVGAVPSGLPHFGVPVVTQEDFALAQELLPGAFLVAMVTFLSSFAGAKKFSMVDGYTLDPTSELLSLGVANFGGSMFGAVPVQIGLSRLGISRSVGIQTQLGANIGVATVISLVLIALSSYFYFVPRCVLSCIILNAASHLTEFQEARHLFFLAPKWSRRKDFFVWMVAFFATVGLGALKGICLAVIVSLVLLIYRVAEPPFHILGYVADKHGWYSTVRPEASPRPGFFCFRMDGPLFYANAESIEETVTNFELDEGAKGNHIRGVVFSASAVTFIDSTGLQVLQSMIVAHADRGVPFVIANAFGKSNELIDREIRAMILEKCAKGVPKPTWSILKRHLEHCSFEDVVGVSVAFLEKELAALDAEEPPELDLRSISEPAGVPVLQLASPGPLSPGEKVSSHFRPLVESSQFQSNPSLYSLANHHSVNDLLEHWDKGPFRVVTGHKRRKSEGFDSQERGSEHAKEKARFASWATLAEDPDMRLLARGEKAKSAAMQRQVTK